MGSVTRKFSFTGICLTGVIFAISGAAPGNSETIREAVQRSLSNSDARKVAIQSIKAQNKQVAIAQANRGINVNLYGELAVEQVDDSTLDASPDNGETQFARQVGLAATYPLYDGLRSLNELYREATLLDAEIMRLSDATETIALNAVQAYLDVYRRRSILAISQQNIEIHSRITDQVSQQVDAGKLSEPDRFQASDKLLAARLAHADAKASLDDAVSRYQFVIGTSPRGALSIRQTGKLPASRSAAEAAAVRNSHLIRLAQKDIDALSHQNAIDAAEWQPQVDLFARGAFEEDVEGTPGTESTLSAGISLNWTIYKGGSKQATEARNRDLLMRAHYRKKQVSDEVRDLARRSWNGYAAAVERRALLRSTVSNNEKIVAAFKREFEAAKRPLLQVLDAERALFNLKVRQANVEAAVAFQEHRILAAQSLLARHFGLLPFGSSLSADFATRVKASPQGGFNITPEPLE